MYAGQVVLVLVGASLASGLVVGAPARTAGRASAPAMGADESRRSFIAAALLFAPAAANAMTIPGLNAPGLIPATKKAPSPKPEWDSFRDTSHFWSSEGVRCLRCPRALAALQSSGTSAARRAAFSAQTSALPQERSGGVAVRPGLPPGTPDVEHSLRPRASCAFC